MQQFLDEDFLLPDEPSRLLFHQYAEGMPILDYHCHLPPSEIATNSHFASIAEAWLGGDHYKWRLMRANGIPEADITGHAADYSTFLAWARTVPKTIGNPLYHWTHLELRRYFGVDLLLSEKTAPAIWEACNAALSGPGFGARDLLSAMKVRGVCTTDDPADDLAQHRAYAGTRGSSEPVMVPAFRPDKALAIDDPAAWNPYIDRLASSSGQDIARYSDLIDALESRHAAFHELGCRASDHAFIVTPFRSSPGPALETSFAALRSGKALGPGEAEAFRTAILLEVGRMDARRGWAMQLHLGAERNLNSRMLAKTGPDTGFDASGDPTRTRPLSSLLDSLDSEGKLPKTILYSNNPGDYEALATTMGCFQDGSFPGKMQLGSAWWFSDHVEGMERQMKVLANVGLLSRFVGMLTDSRSFLSFPRHEYFRRILCGLVGGWIEVGEAPDDYEGLGAMVRDISYNNARDYFAIPGVGG